MLPGGGVQIIGDQIHALTSAPKKGLGLGVIVGLLTSLWSANAGVKSLFDALNAVYEEKETRSFFHRTWLSLAFTVGALVFVIAALFAVVIVPAILKYVGLGAVGDFLLSFGRWPALLLGIMLFLALTYRYGPSRAKAKWRWVSWGSAFAGVFWLVGSLAFSWYAASFGNYNKTYGSLGAAVGFMTWIWISTIIVLVGAELNAEMEHQTARDSTAGRRSRWGRGGPCAPTRWQPPRRTFVAWPTQTCWVFFGRNTSPPLPCGSGVASPRLAMSTLESRRQHGSVQGACGMMLGRHSG